MDADHAIVFMFSGQGSQAYHMGRDLFDGNATFRAEMQRLDRVAQGLIGRSVIERAYHPSRRPIDRFVDLADTSLAIYIVEIALAQTLKAHGIVPDITFGVSLGFFAAATVAGALAPEDALQILTNQAAAIESRCARGGMLAVLGPMTLHRELGLSTCCDVAAVNAPSHFVLAADEAGLATAEAQLTRHAIAHQRLAVEYAFHSRWMEAARAALATLLTRVQGRRARMPLVCSARAAAVPTLKTDDAWTVARSPIKMAETVAFLEQEGPYLYVDAGPSGTLAAILRSALPPSSSSRVAAILTPFKRDLHNLGALTAMCAGGGRLSAAAS